MKYVGVLMLLTTLCAAAQEDAHPALRITPETTELAPLTVYGKHEEIPCLGCEKKGQGPPALMTYGTAVGIWALTPFFQQPRVRGEPNDEAAYYALRSAQCIDDAPGCIDRHPNRDLYNWVPGDPEEDAALNPANSVLRAK